MSTSDSDSPDEGLHEGRARGTLKLKSRFESIFDKYGRDFTGVGDEIDLETGRIIVDNGHVASMKHEKDAGLLGDIEEERDAIHETSDAEADLSDWAEDAHILDANFLRGFLRNASASNFL